MSFSSIISFIYKAKMGNSDSKESKTVDSNGNVNNNIVLQESIPIHSNSIVTILTIICAIKVFELVLFLYKLHLKKIKRKYVNPNNP